MWIIYQVPELLLKINVWQAAWESFQGYCKIFYLLINPSQAGKHWELVWEDPGENLKLWCSFSSFKFLLKIPSRARISRAVDNSVHQKFGFNYCCQLVAVSHWYFKLQSLSRHMPSNISHSSEIDVITLLQQYFDGRVEKLFCSNSPRQSCFWSRTVWGDTGKKN